MKNKWKRILVLALAIFIVAGTCVGCGGNKGGSDDLVTLTWYMRKPIDNMSSEDIVMEEVNRILGEKIGVNLDIVFIESGSYDEKLNVLCSSGDKFDMCCMTDGTRFKKYVENGSFVALDELLAEYGKDILAKQDETIKINSKYEGKVYAVDCNSAYSTGRSFVFKKDLVDKYNFDYKSVKSLSDLEPYLKTIKENEPGIIPLFPGVTDFVNETYSDSSVDGVVFNEETETFEMKYDNDAVVAEAKIKNDFYVKGYIASDAISRTDEMSERKSGQYAVFNNNGYYSEDGSKATSVFGYPCVEAYAGNTVITLKSSPRVCISATSEYPEKCVQVLNLIWQDDYLLNTLAYGLEGVNYTINEERSQELGAKSVDVKSGNAQSWAIWHNWMGSLWDQWDSAWNTAEGLANIKANNEAAKVSKTVGFAFNEESVKAEVAKVSATYQSVARVFDIGCMDNFDSYLENVRKEMKSSGIEKVLAEMNKQYKEWKKQ